MYNKTITIIKFKQGYQIVRTDMAQFTEYLKEHPLVENGIAVGGTLLLATVGFIGIKNTIGQMIEDRGGIVNCEVVSPQDGGSVMTPDMFPSCNSGNQESQDRGPLSYIKADFSNMDVIGLRTK